MKYKYEFEADEDFEKGCCYSAQSNMLKYLELQNLTEVELDGIEPSVLQQFLHHILELD